jgi:glucokinase
MRYYIALDIGGTKLRAASFQGQKVEPTKRYVTFSQEKGTESRDNLIYAIRAVWPQNESVEAIGIAVAGSINLRTGVIEKSPNIPAFTDFPIVNFLEETFQVPIYLGNDANLAALGEWKVGAGIGHNFIIYLTISTGIGSGVINNGKLLLGVNGMGAELGHVTMIPDGIRCSCGKKGHLEAYASGPAITRWFLDEIEKGEESILKNVEHITSKEIANAAYKGDHLSIEAYNRAGYILGLAIVNFLHIFNPTCIIFGGGVSNSIDLMLPKINKVIHDEALDSGYYENLTLTTSKLHDDVGIIGALVLAREIRDLV